MARYAVDHRRNVLIASWNTGSGDTAVDVADMPAGISSHDALNLARTLTQLSDACWRCYTHPASAAGSHEPNSEGERRQEERDAFTSVLTALTNPNLPTDGHMIQSYIRVEEAAHQVGRALHALNAAELTTRVTIDVGAELAAIEQAELGNLSERARQAVALTREDASPVQVAQASSLLHDNPFGPEALFTEIDPAAAAVAAAHWLDAAATITAEYARFPATQVVVEADNIEALPHEAPTLILERMADGATPRQAVMSLIRDALRVAEGEIPDITALQQRIAAAPSSCSTSGARTSASPAWTRSACGSRRWTPPVLPSTFWRIYLAAFVAAGCCTLKTRPSSTRPKTSTMRNGISAAQPRSSRKSGQKLPLIASASCSATGCHRARVPPRLQCNGGFRHSGIARG